MLKRFSIICLLLLSFGPVVWSQTLPTPPAVYVSGGPPTGTCNSGVTFCTIYVQNGTGFTPVLTLPAANFESLAIGPDNVDTDSAGNAAHPFLLYACDSAGKTIIRFDPATPSVTQLVYSGGTPVITPVCGRSTATGDFYVTDKSGPGVYRIFNTTTQVLLANVPYPATPIGASATRIDTSTSITGITGRATTQKYVGDLLVVDNGNNQVLHSVYGAPPLFKALSALITTNLNGPVGIANAPSLRQIFVSNSNSLTQSAVSVFDATGTLAGTPCSGLSLPSNNKQVPNYLATAPTDQFSLTGPNKLITDTIYLVTNANNAGTLWTWNAAAQGNCNLISAATAKAPLSGVAVPPAPVTLTLPVTASVPTNFLYNSNLFQLTTTQSCTNDPPTATVTAYPFSLATVKSMITRASNASNPQTPAVNLGDGGFETVYESYNPQCGAVFPNDSAIMLISNFVDPSQYTNPRYLDCHNSDPTTEPKLVGGTTCPVAPTLGSYPLGGPLAGDFTGKLSNFFALVNENAGTDMFCGFQQPLTGDGTNLPNPLPSFSASATTTVNVKFKISTLAGNCKKNFITDARALLSVARIFDANGATVFNAINPNPTSSSINVPPIFPPGNSQYSFTLNLPSVFAQARGAGTYSITVTFLSDNTTNKITEFILTQ